ncbi:hypothetical protein EU524_00060 [Candidatus Thorarchaeota archaeon]|nr:MAG: hypothetical protein EU524_00060 [Candidatus Thorarchaeota archaeon]
MNKLVSFSLLLTKGLRMASSVEIIVVGHLSRDLIITPESRREALGGSTAYAMIAPSIGALGAGIVSKVGEDFESQYRGTLEKAGLDLTGLHVEGPASTRFVNEYNDSGERVQTVEAIAPPIVPQDFSDMHLDATTIHFSPLTGEEVDIKCIEEARTSGALTSLDVQGYLRHVREDGVVQPSSWRERDEVLRLVDVVKFHESELRVAYSHESELSVADEILSLGPKIVLVTRDRRGSSVYTRNAQVDIPLVLSRRQVDTTGSGDTYAISFLMEYMRTADVKRAGYFAATCSSFNVESVGPYGIPSRLEVEQRLSRHL